MFNVNFTMSDGRVSITQNHYCELPEWVTARTQIMKSHFARIQLNDYASRFFGTDDVIVTLHYVDGVEYAY